MEAVRPSIHPADYAIFAVLMLVTLAICIYHACTGGKQQNTSDYLTGDRKLNFVSVSFSMMATFFSAILILGIPAEAYTFGGASFMSCLALPFGAVLAVIVFVPVLYPLKLTSVNEYLLRRYHSRFVSILGTLSGVTAMNLVCALVYFAPATAIQAITGFPTWASILTGSLFTMIYTTIGGIKAVVWTDVFQCLLMLAGLLTIAIQAIMKVGGISEVWEIAHDWERLNVFNFNPDPTVRLTFWSSMIGNGLFEMSRFGIQQAGVQRYCSLPTVTKARIAVLGLAPTVAVMFFLANLSGIAIFAFYAQLGCDPVDSKIISNPNQLVPYFVMQTLNYPGIPGILMASLAAASLSTASSSLNSTSANVWKDILCVIWPDLPEKRNVLITKLLVVLFGLVSTGLSFIIMNLGGTLHQMVFTFISTCGGPTMAMFLLGMFFPFTNWIGASVGGFGGFGFALWMAFGAYSTKKQLNFLPTTIANCSDHISGFMTNGTLTTMSTTIANLTTMIPETNPLDTFYSVSYLWTAAYGMVVAIIIGLLVSLITGRMHGEKISTDLLHPWVQCCYHTDEEEQETIKEHKEKEVEKSYENGYVKARDDDSVGDPTYKKADVFVTRM